MDSECDDNVASSQLGKITWMLQKAAVVRETSQIQAPTPKNTYGFKIGSQEMAQVKAVDEVTLCCWNFPVSLQLFTY